MDPGVALGLVVGFGTVVGLVWRAWTQAHVPSWAAVIGPLVVLIAVRRTFAGLTPDATSDWLAERVSDAAQIGVWLAALGLLSAVGGVAAAQRGKGSPELVGVGALTMAAGIVGWHWAAGEAMLWAVAADPDAIDVARTLAVMSFEEGVFWALALCGGVALPASAWGFARDRWIGLGESVAAGVLVVVVFHTGKPARVAVEAAYAGWLGDCDVEVVATQAYDRHPVVRRQACDARDGVHTLGAP